MDIVAAKESLRRALDAAYNANNTEVHDLTLDTIVQLGWAEEFGMTLEEEGA